MEYNSLMQYYFALQYKRIIRKLDEFGLHLLIFIIGVSLMFIFTSLLIFQKTNLAPWLLGLILITILLGFGEKQRIENLKSIFTKSKFYQLRVIENILVALPFIIFLFYQQSIWIALGLVPISIILAFFNSKQQLSFTMPTPFRKIPFEYIIGFRKTYVLILISYFLIIKSIQVSNQNLGLFGLASLFLIGMSFYTKLEKHYFVWIHSHGAHRFLFTKLKAGIICSSLLSFPAVLVLCIYFPSDYLKIILILLIGYTFICAIILAKYSSYPKEMNLPQAILLGLSLWFPPMILVMAPIFFNQSRRRLNPILE